MAKKVKLTGPRCFAEAVANNWKYKINCSDCDKPIENKFKYCPYCGEKFK